MPMIDVILKSNVIGLGNEGDIVKVRPGYFRNYLYPKGFGVLTTKNNLRILEKNKDKIAERQRILLQEGASLKEKIESLSLVFERKIIEGDKIYGSISPKDILTFLEENQIILHKQNIEMPGYLRRLGHYTIQIKLPGNQKAMLKIDIVPLEG